MAVNEGKDSRKEILNREKFNGVAPCLLFFAAPSPKTMRLGFYRKIFMNLYKK